MFEINNQENEFFNACYEILETEEVQDIIPSDNHVENSELNH
jgi:hypothetical protein